MPSTASRQPSPPPLVSSFLLEGSRESPGSASATLRDFAAEPHVAGAPVRQLPLVDLRVVKQRMEDTIARLTEPASKKKSAGRDKEGGSKKKSRHELMELLRDDVVHYYQYSPELAEYFLQV